MTRRMFSEKLQAVFATGTAVLALHATAASAWAQKSVKPAEESSTLQWVIALGVMVVVGIAAFLNPKRSHRA